MFFVLKCCSSLVGFGFPDVLAVALGGKEVVRRKPSSERSGSMTAMSMDGFWSTSWLERLGG
jgi:hypothetical protein